MKKIYKYDLTDNFYGNGDNTVEMPAGSIIRHVGVQNRHIDDSIVSSIVICIWIECDPNADMAKRVVSIHGTGDDLPEDRIYVGSVQTRSFVWHVYDGGETIIQYIKD